MDKTKGLGEPDYVLFLLTSALIAISIIFSYSLSVYTVRYFDYNDFHFFVRQLAYGVVAIAIMYYFLSVDPYKHIGKIGMGFFLFFLFLIVIMPALPSVLVTESGGAKRWIKFPGLSLSPVEFFKIGFIYFLAWSFKRRVVDKTSPMQLLEEYALFAPYFIIFIIVIFFVAYLQKDLGQTFLLGVILLVFIIFANRSKRLLFSLFMIGIVGFITLVAVAGHRIKRIAEWWAMHQDALLGILPDYMAKDLRVSGYDEPYQVGHSLNAIANGGIDGAGIGNGFLKMGFLSEVHTDFVLAGITEELGVLGMILILILVFFIAIRIFRISNKIENDTFHFFTLGIGIMIVGAFFINSLGISGLIPIKGIAVPFLSYGGSSMIAAAIGVGMVLSISRDITVDEEEKVVQDEEISGETIEHS